MSEEEEEGLICKTIYLLINIIEEELFVIILTKNYQNQTNINKQFISINLYTQIVLFLIASFHSCEITEILIYCVQFFVRNHLLP